ncbi:MAG: TonB-dependent receptor plug domain-containing protein [Roseivirga sp.]|nr:TonB-dependent receptor plug domain-containing protein [Roseivirga sp.]
MLFRSLLLAGLFIVQQSIAQVENPIVTKLHDYTYNRPEEKVYLHFDKPYYVPGETIWFKTYITLGGDHLPSLQSGLLYVDFYDEQENLINQLRIRCQNGFGNGHFNLPADLNTDKLRVRAYTNWMKNFNPDFFFQKSIPLISESERTAPEKSQISVGIYPEGGQMINGVTNRLAVKTDKAMAGKVLQLMDTEGEELDEVVIDDRGYGSFTLKPDVGESYTLAYQNQYFPLPVASEKGIALTLNNYSYPNFARLTLRKKPGSHPDMATVLVHTRGTVHHVAELDFSRSVAITNIPKTILPAGVNHLTIFDDSGKPLAERLFYVDRNDPVHLGISTADNSFSKREKVEVELNLSDLTGKDEVRSHLSFVATQSSEVVRAPYEENIKTYLLLNSDLRGSIKDPGFYFEDNSKEKRFLLDRVMMTHGWRRFAWEKLLSQGMDSVQYEPERGMTLRGRLVGKTNKKPIVNGTVTYLNNQNGQTVMRTRQTNDLGEFEMYDLPHGNLNKISLKGIITGKGFKRARKQFVAFELDTTTKTATSPWLIPADPIELSSPEATEGIMANTQKRELYDSIYNFDPDVRTIQGVTIESETDKLDFTRNKISSIYGKGSLTFEVPDEPRALASRDIFSLIAGKMAGVQITSTLNPANTIVEIRGGGGGLRRVPPKFILNDQETDLTTLVYLPVDQIDRVEVYKGPDAAIFGLETIGGVIAVYTKSGFEANEVADAEQGLYAISLPGLQAPREFFSPDYSKDKPEHVKPDIRSLVHWQPTVVTDSTGKAKVAFWTTDNTGVIDIEVQGLTYAGKPVVVRKSIAVKEED